MSPLIAASFILTASTTLAQSRGFAQIDTNGNGLLSYDELVLAFGAAGANQLWGQNSGRDISVDDIRRINGDDGDDNDDDDSNDDDDDASDDDDDNDSGDDDDDRDDDDDNDDDDGDDEEDGDDD